MAVANQVSDQLTLTDAYKKEATPTETKPFRRYFSITTAVGDATSTIRLTRYYAGERLMGGRIAGVIFMAGGGTFSLGTGLPLTGVPVGGAASLLALTAADAAVDVTFGTTPALRLGELQTADGELILTTAVAALLAAKVVAGWLDVLRVG